MKNIAVIGHTGKLGSALMTHPNAMACPWMFENDRSVIDNWLLDNPQIDTIWHVARACRADGPRRDNETFLLEQNAMQNLLSTRAKSCRFVYASSKIVYGLGGLSDQPEDILPAEKVAETFNDDLIGTFNCPTWQHTRNIDISKLDHQRTIYALTKLSNEQLIRRTCTNHKIVRIWDIL
jgi:nucleoside-diphosphate-sugar epimerase